MTMFKYENKNYQCEVITKKTNKDVITIRLVNEEGERNIYTWGFKYKHPYAPKTNEYKVKLNVIRKAIGMLTGIDMCKIATQIQ
ncbi:MAG: hypothetical protein J6D12_01600 [Peptostreptococcaceae bacterium]|jgi:hypothetical protein|nr:hypothetical protein [Peptostreptococcaceae bacterium]